MEKQDILCEFNACKGYFSYDAVDAALRQQKKIAHALFSVLGNVISGFKAFVGQRADIGFQSNSTVLMWSFFCLLCMSIDTFCMISRLQNLFWPAHHYNEQQSSSTFSSSDDNNDRLDNDEAVPPQQASSAPPSPNASRQEYEQSSVPTWYEVLGKKQDELKRVLNLAPIEVKKNNHTSEGMC